jgi:hypothetical protein
MPKECIDPATDDSSKYADENVGDDAAGRFAGYNPTRHEANHEPEDGPS